MTRHLLHFISDPHASPQPATPRRGRRAKSRGTQRAYEPLERRVMFDGTVTLTDGTLEVIGTSGDDLVRATLIELPDTGETVYQVFSGGRTTNFNPAAVLRVTVLGLGGDDNIAVRNRPANIDGGPGKDNLGGSDFGDILRGGPATTSSSPSRATMSWRAGTATTPSSGWPATIPSAAAPATTCSPTPRAPTRSTAGPAPTRLTASRRAARQNSSCRRRTRRSSAPAPAPRTRATPVPGTPTTRTPAATPSSSPSTPPRPAREPSPSATPTAAPPTGLALEVNGTVLVPRLSFAPTGSWAIWKSTETAPLTLAAGTNRVKLISIGSNGPNIDALTLNNAGVPPARPVFEAEQATLSGAVVSRNHPGYSGTGFADVINASGDYIEWTVQGRGNFDQTIYVRYANGSTSARTMRLTISGSNEERMIDFAPTGSWSNWETTFAEVTLVEGPVRVRLTAVGSSGPNIDWLQI